jgi:hypothetical protein
MAQGAQSPQESRVTGREIVKSIALVFNDLHQPAKKVENSCCLFASDTL